MPLESNSDSKADLFLASLAEGTSVAGTFTRSKCPVRARRMVPSNPQRRKPYSPGLWCATRVTQTPSPERSRGHQRYSHSRDVVAEVPWSSTSDRVYLASTGVIGEPLPDDILSNSLPGVGRQSWTSLAHRRGPTLRRQYAQPTLSARAQRHASIQLRDTSPESPREAA